VYLFSVDEEQKRRKAEKLLQAGALVISTQVLNEFSNVMLRKFGLSAQDVELACRELTNAFTVSAVTVATIFSALKLKARYGFSYFDALMVSSALEQGCSTLYSEALQHGLVVEGRLTVINPFRD